MTRKLHHTMIALSATAAVFTAFLLAASPVQERASVALVAVAPVNAGMAVDTLSIIADATQASSGQRRRQRHSRAVLALPYFSFAQGLRRNRS